MDFLIAVGSGALVVDMTNTSGGVSGILLILDLLVSLIGVLSKSNLWSPNIGTLFILPSLVGRIEYTYCCDGGGPSWLNKLGGHVWYDIVLHTIFRTILKDGLPKRDALP